MDKMREEFDKNGFVVIPDFFDEKEIQDLKKAVHKIIDDMDVRQSHKSVFAFDSMPNDDYATTAGDKIRFFFEKGAFNESGELVVDKHESLNKLGYALHTLEPTFRRITFSSKVQQLVKELGFVKPRVAQSMYIFKNPSIGGIVLPHQDATYLNAIPRKAGERTKEIGVWMPLEDATEENGCLSFIPGSQKTGLHRQSIKNPDSDYPPFVYTKELPDYDEQSWVTAPAKKGSVLLIDGLVVHRSAHNSSKYPRPIYTFHLYDDYSCEWDSRNWLQIRPGNQFPYLYSN